MLRYSLILLLVTIYGRSLGGPVPGQNSNGKTSIANLLSDLSKQCKNKFVLGQIEIKNSSCDVIPNYHIASLQCLMFYDANRLLCDSAADFETELTAKLSDKQNVSAFCNEVSHLTVPASPYQKSIVTVFQEGEVCKRVCADDDIMTGDTNFFCKYYRQTLLTLLPVQGSQQQHPLTSTANLSGASSVAEQKIDTTAIQANHSANGEVKNSSDAASRKTKPVKAEETNLHTLEAVNQESSSMAQLTNAQNSESPILPSNVDSTDSKLNQKPPLDLDKNTLDHGDKAEENRGLSNPDVDPIDDGSEIGIENNDGNKDPEVLRQQIETPGQNVGLENNDDGGDIDMDEDEKDGSDDEDQNGIDLKARQQDARNPNPKLETQGAQIAEGSQREFFQTTDGFTEDDDHFFPFFLTAVIVVVVLYVLYHNKNKVAKMFFGLIVEGRQPGRRRNSRGHAYRRLDTLEQAMSANTTAPPSKIIY